MPPIPPTPASSTRSWPPSLGFTVLCLPPSQTTRAIGILAFCSLSSKGKGKRSDLITSYLYLDSVVNWILCLCKEEEGMGKQPSTL